MYKSRLLIHFGVVSAPKDIVSRYVVEIGKYDKLVDRDDLCSVFVALIRDASEVDAVQPSSSSTPAQEQKTMPPIIEDKSNSFMTYILNTNTKKFHYPSCRSAEQIKEKNKQEFTGTRDDVIAQGYSPCGICHP